MKQMSYFYDSKKIADLQNNLNLLLIDGNYTHIGILSNKNIKFIINNKSNNIVSTGLTGVIECDLTGSFQYINYISLNTNLDNNIPTFIVIDGILREEGDPI